MCLFFAAEEAEAARRAHEEHWEKAKEHGERAKEVTSYETNQRLERQGATTTTTSTTPSSQTRTGGQEGVPSALSDVVQPSGQEQGGDGSRPAETGATDLSKTLPEHPSKTKAGGVELPAEEVRK